MRKGHYNAKWKDVITPFMHCNILILNNYMYDLICYVTLYYEKDKKKNRNQFPAISWLPESVYNMVSEINIHHRKYGE